MVEKGEHGKGGGGKTMWYCVWAPAYVFLTPPILPFLAENTQFKIKMS